MNTTVIISVSFLLPQVTHKHFYSKGMIAILDTLEDEEIVLKLYKKALWLFTVGAVKILGLINYKSYIIFGHFINNRTKRKKTKLLGNNNW